MKNNIWQDFYRRMNYLKNEARIWFIKSIIFESSMFLIDWTKATFLLKSKLSKFSKVKIMHRCVITGRAKSVLWTFRLSRMEFKRIASLGLLPGLKKWGF